MSQDKFMEQLRDDLGARAKPQRSMFELRCSAKKHPLLWIVPFEGGLVPVIKSGQGRFRFEGVVGQDGEIRPRTLADFNGDDVLPVGNCACGNFRSPTKHTVNAWITQGLKVQMISPELH
jgi:hypothetical protein